MPDFMDACAATHSHRNSLRAPSLFLQRFAVAVTVSLSACSGSSDPAPSAGNSLPQGVQDGYFRGGNVAGLDFASGAQTGTTDEAGAYLCEEDQQISFSIGSVALGGTDCASVVHAAALTDSGLLTDPVALNITRFLMTLDEDQNPDNGIYISEALRGIADNWTQPNFAAEDFEGELMQVVSDIASVEGRIASTPDEAAAFVFLDASVACAYSGVFVDRFSGETGEGLNAALRVFRNPETNEDVSDFLIIRQDPVTPTFLESSSDLILETLPSIADNMSFFADYVSPDLATGSWHGAITLQGIDRNGDFNLSRLGIGSGEYRFVGDLDFDSPLGSSQDMLARIELELDGDTLTASAFNLFFGIRLPVTGTRIADSNEFEIEASNLGTATVTVVLDANGEPTALEGNWPYYEEQILKAVGCRLT